MHANKLDKCTSVLYKITSVDDIALKHFFRFSIRKKKSVKKDSLF